MRNGEMDHWRGNDFRIINPAKLQTAAKKGPIEFYRTDALPDPIGAAALELSTTQPNGDGQKFAFLYTATIAVGGNLTTLASRWQDRVAGATRVGNIDNFIIEPGNLTTRMSIRHPMILLMSAGLQPDGEHVVLTNDPNKQLISDELSYQYAHIDTVDAIHQLRSFLHAASLVIDMCVSLEDNRSSFYRRRLFPPKPLGIRYDAGKYIRRIGFHRQKQDLEDTQAITKADTEDTMPDTITRGQGFTSADRKKPPEQPADLIGEYKWPEHDLDDLHLPLSLQNDIASMLLLAKNPGVASEWGITVGKRLLLHGPPGTGKTSIAHGIAKANKAIVWEVNPDNIYGKYLGDSEGTTKRLFNQARAVRQPTLLLFDEFDGFFSDPETDNIRSENAVTSIMKRELGTFGRDNPNLLLVATTNKSPDDIDPAVTRIGRFDIRSYVPEPNHVARFAIFTLLAHRYAQKSTAPGNEHEKYSSLFEYSIDFATLAAETDGMNGNSIARIIEMALQLKAQQQVKTRARSEPVNTDDLRSAIEALKTAEAD
ncbi:MAG TPA: ATP-binding protein [Candidatus Saccharimonadales bacterium]|nr:ATP-binding protein [Candidatus Saccharimonadales bacterium]